LVEFDPGCTACPRLSNFLGEVRKKQPGYHARPVPSFGPPDARLLIVGLAPGMHGANRTGRPFTGDYAGILLYRTLFENGFSNAPVATDRNDGLQLHDCRITNAVRCLPPGNKPEPDEVKRCNGYLRGELAQLPREAVVLALGRIAHAAILKAFDRREREHPFGHGAEHLLSGGIRLLDSYHCSRYNTQTRRLTEEMFSQVIRRARELLP
jgi:uracil-DNA glycosylase family 4